MSNFFLIWYIVGFISTIIGIIIHKKKLIDIHHAFLLGGIFGPFTTLILIISFLKK